MSPNTQVLIGLFLVSAAWLLGRWASSYDVKGWATNAAWRMIWRRDWRLLKNPIHAAIEGDEILKAQIAAKTAVIASDMRKNGAVQAVAKHGFFFALANTLLWIVTPTKLLGMLVLMHALYRYLA